MQNRYDWEFIRPLDQSSTIANLALGNKQITDGLQGMSNAVTGLADTYKQRNTDSILNALYQAQTSADMPNAMSAVQALQQQYGRGYDQKAVREAVDSRGSVLQQRDLQAINLQQAQAAQAAIPQLNEFAAQMAAGRKGMTPEQIQAINGLAGLGINASDMINSFSNTAVNDYRDNRDYTDRRNDVDYQRNYQAGRDRVMDSRWEEENARANIGTAATIAGMYEKPAEQGWTTVNGEIVPYSSPGVSKGDAFSAIMGSLYNVESRGQHRDRNGNLTQSPKGALGVAQIMPATAAKPGYGMKPINLQTSTEQEQKAWSEEYINRIAKHHNFTIPQAVAAYNAGPGAVQKAVKNNGANWLNALPAETRAYVPKVLNGAGQGTAAQATAAIGTGVSNANMSKVTAGYQDGLAKLTGEFNLNQAKAAGKGSLASTGKNVDTWLASKKEFSLMGGSMNPMFTDSHDIAKMAKADPAFKNLPAEAQIKVLDGAYGFVNSTGKLEYVPNKELKKFINQESTKVAKQGKNEFEVAKQNLFESTYQNMVQQFQAVGSAPPSREAFRKLVDPQAPAAKTQSAADNIKATAKQAVQAVKPKAASVVPYAPSTPAAKPSSNLKAVDTSKMDKQMAERAKRKAAQTAAINAKVKRKEESKSLADTLKVGKPLLPNQKTMSAKQIDDLMKKYNVR